MSQDPQTGESGRYAALGSEQVTPPANQADAAWTEMVALRARAAELGLEVDERWPIIRLREEIAQAEAVGG
jgi:hypothetical protein